MRDLGGLFISGVFVITFSLIIVAVLAVGIKIYELVLIKLNISRDDPKVVTFGVVIGFFIIFLTSYILFQLTVEGVRSFLR